MQSFRNLSTTLKLLLLTAFSGALIALVGIGGVRAMERMSGMITVLFQRDMVAIAAADQASISQVNLAKVVRQVIIDVGTPDEEQDRANYQRIKTELDGELGGLERMVSDGDGRKEYLEIIALRPQYYEAAEQAMGAAQRREKTWREALARVGPVGIHMRDLLLTIQKDKTARGRSAYEESEAAYLALRRQAILLVLGSIFGSAAIAFFVARAIARPLGQTEALLAQVAAGDLSQRIDVRSTDEVGRTNSSLNHALDKLSAALQAIDRRADGLANASQRLTSIGQLLGSTSQESAGQASSVAAACEQVSSNVQTVTAAANEMSTAVREIAKNSGEATNLAQAGAQAAEMVRSQMGELGASSASIGAVVKLISGIAEQTNLLALNATIEAARAGEAGKGFAVVANEVKELAKASASSTGEIAAKVSAIQAATSRSIEAITQVASIIAKIADQQGMVAAAVEEQVATTNEISRNVGEASRASNDIASSAGSVAAASKQTSECAQEALKHAHELAETAAQLRAEVARFRFQQDGAQVKGAAAQQAGISVLAIAQPAA